MTTLTVGSLFSGIGGIDLGLERAGMTVKWQSEIDPYACKVLAKHWLDVPNLGDIKKIDWKETEYVDVIAGGYPCQPFSTAGKRAGEEDPRHLWPWVREAISHIRPKYAILENVRGHLSLGGLSVIGELASIGYDAEWRVVSAASVGANHLRNRVIIVAYPNRSYSPDGRQCTDVSSKSVGWGNDGRGSETDIGQISLGEARQPFSIMANADYARSGTSKRTDFLNWPTNSEERLDAQFGIGRRSSDVADADLWQIGRRNGWDESGRSKVFGGRNQQRGTQGYAGGQWWETEPDVGRVANGIPSRVDRLKCLGNAVVPQVAEIIGRLVVEHSNN